MRTLPLLALFACGPATITVDGLDDRPGEGWATDPYETWTTDPSEETDPYAGATLTVVSPASGAWLNLGAVHAFEAALTSPTGAPLPLDDVEWSSDLAPNWFERGAAFESDGIPVGIHAFTATATLPNGAVLQHTVGAVRVQHAFAGTYAGLLDVDGTILNLPISCVGAGIIVVDRFGEIGAGDGDCLVSLLGADVPLHLIYDLEVAPDATIGGTVGVDLLGFFTYNFDAEGALDPSATLSLGFAGDVPLMGPLTGSTTAERISLDTE